MNPSFIALAFYIILNFYKPNLISKPIKFISFWWLSLLALSTLSTTGLYSPGLKTQFICLLMLSGFNLGSLGKIPAHITENFREEKIEKLLSLLFKISAIVQFCIVIFVFVKSVIMLSQIHDASTYRSVAFSTTETVGTLFNSRILENLYFLISSPLLFFLVIYGLASYINKNRPGPLVIALLLNTMDGFMRLARINIYCAIVLLVFVYLLKNNPFKVSMKGKLKAAVLCLIIGGFLVGIGSRRHYNISNQVELFFVDYHTVGFTLFDQELKNPESRLNTENTYGRLFFGGMETVFTIVIRQFDKTYMSPALENAIKMGENRVTGIEKVPSITFHGIKRYNSFYTILYTLYSDGKFPGVFIGGCLMGWLLRLYYSKWEVTRTSLNLMWVILLSSTMIFSIFVSQLEIMRTWMLATVFFIVEIYYRLKNRPAKA